MSGEREERLFLAIGGVSDALVNEAAQPGEPREKKPAWARWGALAAALVLVVGVVRFFPRMGGSTNGFGISGGDAAPEESVETSFMSYAGPVLPLTVVDGPEDLSATREVTWDFASALEGKGSSLYTVAVTDATAIQNDKGEDLAITIGYPVTAALQDGEERFPVLSVNGERLETGLLWGDRKTGGSFRLESWNDVKILLEDGSCLEEAQKPAPALEQTVTVWELTDSTAPDTDRGAPTLAITFQVDEEKTQVYTWGFNGVDYGEDGQRRYSYFVRRKQEPDSRRFLIFLGEVPERYTMAGYENGACEKLLDGVSAQMAAFTTSLGELMDRLAEERQESLERLDALKDALRRRMAQVLSRREERYNYFFMEDLISDTLYTTRAVWTTAEITIPAGETVTITACYQKEPSYDFACAHTKGQGLYGFDLGTRLGSGLNFTRITARLENAQGLEIVRDTFGFKQKARGWEAELAPETEHCAMEIRLTA